MGNKCFSFLLNSFFGQKNKASLQKINQNKATTDRDSYYELLKKILETSGTVYIILKNVMFPFYLYSI